MTLPNVFLERPIAHRAFHDKAAGRPENSREAVEAAIEAGYGIEVDVQPSKDGHAMVFHDYKLKRLTDEDGVIGTRTAAELAEITLVGGTTGIPTLKEILEIVDGAVPLLIEIKDQDGIMGPNIGALEVAVAHVLKDYDGDAALMSFNPHTVAKMAELAPDRPRGITTSAYTAESWPTLPESVRSTLREISDYQRTGSCFISHEAADLASPHVAQIAAKGGTILCWTVRSAQDEARARQYAANITFEGYDA